MRNVHRYLFASPPPGWGFVRISEAFDLRVGYPFPSGGFNNEGQGQPLVRIRDLLSGEPSIHFDGDEGLDETVENGDIVIGMDGDFNTVWWSSGTALLNQRICRLRGRKDVDPRFAFYQLPLLLQLINDLTPSSTVKHLSSLDVTGLRLMVPTLAKQRRIADFLDRETARIDQLIRKKNQFIELLEKRKEGLLEKVFTKLIHSHSIVRLGRFVISMCDGPFGSGLTSSHYTESGIRVIRLQNIGVDQFKGDDVAYISPEHYATLGDHDVVAGDLLVAGLGDGTNPVGRACVAPKGIKPAMVKADCFRLRFDSAYFRHDFIAKYFASSVGSHAIAKRAKGVTRVRANLGIIASLPIPFVSTSEQARIVTLLDAEFDRVRPIKKRLKYSIASLRDLRDSVITAAVAGEVNIDTWPPRGEIGRYFS